MKHINYILALLILGMTVACGSSTETETATPTTAKDARTALNAKRQEMKKLKVEMANLEALIAKMDPNSVKEKEIIVKVAKVKTKDFRHYVEVQGNVMTAQDPAFASSETGGRIVQLVVKEGQFVKKGALIAEVNLESISKSIAQLDKSLELALDIYKRQENLWKQNIGSEIQYLQAKNQVESLEKNKESLQFELTKASVYAPASGYIDRVMVKEGEMAGPGSPIVQILNTSSLKVVASVPEVYLGNIKRGEKVKISFPALQQEQEARVAMIGRVINPTNRTFEVEATVKSMNGLLKPNLLSTMFVNDFSADGAVVIPDELIQQDVSGKAFVMVAEHDRAAKKIVTLGRTYQNETIVEIGLNGDEVLITAGATTVAEGELLKIIE
jgi:RND family efflux transporter MFP subunit